MCLFGGKIRWMENFEEKMRRKSFWSVFGWVEMKKNKWWSFSVFSPVPSKNSLRNEEKTERGKLMKWASKNTLRIHLHATCWLFLFFFSFFNLLCLLLSGHDGFFSSSSFLIFFFSRRVAFFFLFWCSYVYFLINFGWFLFLFLFFFL